MGQSGTPLVCEQAERQLTETVQRWCDSELGETNAFGRMVPAGQVLPIQSLGKKLPRALGESRARPAENTRTRGRASGRRGSRKSGGREPRASGALPFQNGHWKARSAGGGRREERGARQLAPAEPAGSARSARGRPIKCGPTEKGGREPGGGRLREGVTTPPGAVCRTSVSCCCCSS